MLQGTGLAVHGYSRYVDEEAFRDAGLEIADEVPVYGVEASHKSQGLTGDFYEDTFGEIEHGRNGAVASDDLEGLEEPFYVFGGLVSECVPGAVYSVQKSGFEAYVMEDASFEKVEDDFMTYDEMKASDRDFGEVFDNLGWLGVPTLTLDELVEK